MAERKEEPPCQGGAVNLLDDGRWADVEDAVTVIVEPQRRVTNFTRAVTVPWPGNLTFRFDNNFSWRTAKKIVLKYEQKGAAAGAVCGARAATDAKPWGAMVRTGVLGYMAALHNSKVEHKDGEATVDVPAGEKNSFTLPCSAGTCVEFEMSTVAGGALDIDFSVEFEMNLRNCLVHVDSMTEELQQAHEAAKAGGGRSEGEVRLLQDERDSLLRAAEELRVQLQQSEERHQAARRDVTSRDGQLDALHLELAAKEAAAEAELTALRQRHAEAQSTAVEAACEQERAKTLELAEGSRIELLEQATALEQRLLTQSQESEDHAGAMRAAEATLREEMRAAAACAEQRETAFKAQADELRAALAAAEQAAQEQQTAHAVIVRGGQEVAERAVAERDAAVVQRDATAAERDALIDQLRTAQAEAVAAATGAEALKQTQAVAATAAATAAAAAAAATTQQLLELRQARDAAQEELAAKEATHAQLRSMIDELEHQKAVMEATTAQLREQNAELSATVVQLRDAAAVHATNVVLVDEEAEADEDEEAVAVEAVAVEAAADAEPAAAAAGGIWSCPLCHFANSDEKEFCAMCAMQKLNPSAAAAAAAAEDKHEEAAARGSKLPKRTLLWVDSTPQNNRLLVESATAKGIDVHTVVSSRAALDFLHAHVLMVDSAMSPGTPDALRIITNMVRKCDGGETAGTDLVTLIRKGGMASVPVMVYTNRGLRVAQEQIKLLGLQDVEATNSEQRAWDFALFNEPKPLSDVDYAEGDAEGKQEPAPPAQAQPAPQADSKEGMSAEEAAAHAAMTAKWAPALAQMAEMGFADAEQLMPLLEKHKGNVQQVVLQLVALTQ